MGVTLYYHGRLRQPQLVDDLITEMTDIAIANHWKYHILDDPWDTDVDLKLEHREGVVAFIGNAGLKGIILSPHPECEGVFLLFDHTGTLRTLLDMTEKPENRLNISFTKTQFAGIDVHIQLVHLLEYIGNKYMDAWTLEDDCGFVQHKDREKSLAVFHTVGDAINAMSEAIDTLEIPEDVKKDDARLQSLIEERIRNFLPGAEIMRIENEEE